MRTDQLIVAAELTLDCLGFCTVSNVKFSALFQTSTYLYNLGEC